MGIQAFAALDGGASSGAHFANFETGSGALDAPAPRQLLEVMRMEDDKPFGLPAEPASPAPAPAAPPVSLLEPAPAPPKAKAAKKSKKSKRGK